MILPNELRVGNLTIIYKGTDYESIYNAKYTDLGGHYTILAPIPLTEEWLINLGLKKKRIKGFNENEGQWWCSPYRFLFEYDDNPSVYFYGIIGTNVKYVHQMQNLYYALTGNELTIK